MSSELEKIDIIRSRAGVSYNEAKEALDNAGGDVVQALVNLEEGTGAFCKRIRGASGEMAGRMKDLWQRGRGTKIKVKKDDRTVLEVSANVGAVALLGAALSNELALLGVIGGATAMAKDYRLEISREEKEGSTGRSSFFGPGDMD